jgi:hypothetical protein
MMVSLKLEPEDTLFHPRAQIIRVSDADRLARLAFVETPKDAQWRSGRTSGMEHRSIWSPLSRTGERFRPC